MQNSQLTSLQKKIGPYVFVLSIPQFIWQDLAIAWKSSEGKKSMYYLLEFDEWTEAAIEESVLQKDVLFKTVALQSIKLFVLLKYLKEIQWRVSILLELLTYSLQL